MGTMLMLAPARPGRRWERTLETTRGDEVRKRFVAHADRGLDRAYRLAGLLLGNRADAEDAVGEALLRGWRSLGSLRDADGLDAWFDRILVNICRDRLRRGSKVRFIALDGEAATRTAPDPYREVLERDTAVGGLRDLDPDERVVIVLHFWEDLTLAGVAERTGWPIGTVKSRLHRALGKLGRVLDDPREGRS
jgi:RNA polymerase sigma-70 factor, ECF subfamily